MVTNYTQSVAIYYRTPYKTALHKQSTLFKTEEKKMIGSQSETAKKVRWNLRFKQPPRVWQKFSEARYKSFFYSIV